jgi:hypothetical protein
MGQYHNFEVTRVSQLTVRRSGIFNPSYQLVDGACSYGKMYFKGWFTRTGYIETAGGSWVFKQTKWYCTDINITDTMGQRIASASTGVWKGGVTLTFADGTALQYRRNGIFSTVQSWYSGAYGNLLNIKIKVFSNKTPFVISFEPIITKTNINPLLLAFMGTNVIVTRRAQAAATAN